MGKQLFNINKHQVVVWILLALFALAKTVHAQLPDTINLPQENFYYSDFSDKLAIRLYTLAKSNSLDIRDNTHVLKLRPNGQLNLGLGFNYKKLGLGIAFGIPNSQNKNIEYGKTMRLDIQANMYGKKIGANGYIQEYKGYYNINPHDFIDWEQDHYPQLDGLRVLSIGASLFYIFNDERFSYKAAFVRNQIQKKSAGSIIIGFFATYDQAITQNGFIPDELPDSIRTEFNLSGFRATAIGFSTGYIYTFVISKHFFINLSALPGFGYQRVELELIDGSNSVKNAPAGQLTARTAIGYENELFYIGATASITVRNFTYQEYELDLATEEFRFTIGRRFNMQDKK